MNDWEKANELRHEEIYQKINEVKLELTLLEKEVYRLRTWGIVFITIITALIGPVSNFLFQLIIPH